MRNAIFALGLAGVAACGGSGRTTDVKPTLSLANASDAQLARLVAAAGGTDLFSAEAQVGIYASSTGDPCPAVAVAGDVLTITGGCTTQQGVAIAGSATITNPIGVQQINYNYSYPTTYQLDQFAITQASTTTTFDGFLHITGSGEVYDANLTVDELGIALRSDLYMACSRTGQQSASCTIEGSGLELVGSGGVLVSGTVAVAASSTTASATAHFTLRGTDTLTATIANNCVAWQISGSTRQQVCP